MKNKKKWLSGIVMLFLAVLVFGKFHIQTQAEESTQVVYGDTDEVTGLDVRDLVRVVLCHSHPELAHAEGDLNKDGVVDKYDTVYQMVNLLGEYGHINYAWNDQVDNETGKKDGRIGKWDGTCSVEKNSDNKDIVIVGDKNFDIPLSKAQKNVIQGLDNAEVYAVTALLESGLENDLLKNGAEKATDSGRNVAAVENKGVTYSDGKINLKHTSLAEPNFNLKKQYEGDLEISKAEDIEQSIATTFKDGNFKDGKCSLEVMTVEANVYTMIITDHSELVKYSRQVVKEHPYGHYVMESDVDCTGTVDFYVDSENAFIGTFDGQGHVIKGLEIQGGGKWTHGFLGGGLGTKPGDETHSGGTLKNISFVDAVKKGEGGFLADAVNGTIENVYIEMKSINWTLQENAKKEYSRNTSIIGNFVYPLSKLNNVIIEYEEPLPKEAVNGYPIYLCTRESDILDGLHVVGINKTRFYRWNNDNLEGHHPDAFSVSNNLNTLVKKVAHKTVTFTGWEALDDVFVDFETSQQLRFWTIAYDGIPHPIAVPKDVYTENAWKTGNRAWPVGRENTSETFKIDLSTLFSAEELADIKEGAITATSEDVTGDLSAKYEKGAISMNRAPFKDGGKDNYVVDVVVELENGFKYHLEIPLQMYTMTIGSADELDDFATRVAPKQVNGQYVNLDGHYVLTNDIEYNKTYPGITGSNQNNPFRGIFDGQGYTIKGLKVEGRDESTTVDGKTTLAFPSGFLGHYFGNATYKTATLKNISFVDAEKSGVGGFISTVQYGTLENVYIEMKSINSNQPYAAPSGKNGPGTEQNSSVIATWTGIGRDRTNPLLKNVVVEYETPHPHGATNGYVYADYVSASSMLQGLHVIGEENHSFYYVLNNAMGDSNTYTVSSDRSELSEQQLNFAEWEDSSFWTLIYDGIPHPAKLPRDISLPYDIGQYDSTDKVQIDLVEFFGNEEMEQLQRIGKLELKKNESSDDMSQYYNNGIITIARSFFQEKERGDYTMSVVLQRADGFTYHVNMPISLYTMAIGDSADLTLFRSIAQQYPAGTYVLEKDIDYKQQFPKGDSQKDYVFTGTFDGQGHGIKGMTIAGGETTIHAFMGGRIGPSGILKNVSFLNANKTGAGGYIAGYVDGTIENVYIQMDSVAEYSGKFGLYSAAIAGWINNNEDESTAKINKVIVEYTTEPAKDYGYVTYQYRPKYGIYNGLYVIGAADYRYNNAKEGTSATPDEIGVYASYDAMKNANLDLEDWGEQDFWSLDANGIPCSKHLVSHEGVKGVTLPSYAKAGTVVTIDGIERYHVVSVDAMSQYGITVSGQQVEIPSTYTDAEGNELAIPSGTEITVTVSNAGDPSTFVSKVIKITDSVNKTLDNTVQLGMKDSEDTFTIDLRQYGYEIDVMSLENAKMTKQDGTTVTKTDGTPVSFEADYEKGVLTLDRASLVAEAKSIVVTFMENEVSYNITVPIEVYTMVISDLEELKSFRYVRATAEGLAGTYVLENDITCSVEGDYFNAKDEIEAKDAVFTGTFDGQGHSIKNLKINGGGNTKHAFLGHRLEGTIKNVSFLNATKIGNGGYIASTIVGGTVENVYIQMASINSTDATQSGSAYSSVVGSQIWGGAQIKKVVVEYTGTIKNATSGYAVSEYNENQASYQGLYVIGADALYAQEVALSNTPGEIGRFDSREAMKNARAEGTTRKDFSEWETGGFWAMQNGTPVPVGVVVAAERKGIEATQIGDTLHINAITKNLGRVFIDNGKTEYKIVVPTKETSGDSGDNFTYVVARLLSTYISEATGRNIDIISSQDAKYSETSKYIILNDKELFESAGFSETDILARAGCEVPTKPEEIQAAMDNLLGPMGYYIKTDDGNVFLMSNEEDGIRYAMLAFLREVLDYEAYAWDTRVYHLAKTSPITIPDMVIIERPDITYLEDNNSVGDKSYNMNLMMGFNMETFLTGKYNGRLIEKWHNSTQYLPRGTYEATHPYWYAVDNRNELCYTAHGDEDELNAMASEVAKIMLALLDGDPEAKFAAITMMDRREVGCDCDACKDYKKLHGSDSAAIVNFTNKVNAIVQKDLEFDVAAGGTKRDVTVLFMAYHAYLEPPTSEIKCDPGVAVLLAPIEAYANKPYTHADNKEAKAPWATSTQVKDIPSIVEGWKACSKDNLFVWMYETSFESYLYPYNSWESAMENFRYLYQNGATFIMPQGQWNQQEHTGFTDLKDYLNMKVAFDVNSDYNTLVNKFFANYYGSGSTAMLKYFNELQNWMQQMGNMDTESYRYDGSTYSPLDTLFEQQEFATWWWPQSLMLRWLGYIDDAYAAVEDDYAAGLINKATYEKYIKHIKLESIFPRQVMLTHYASYYTERYSADHLTTLRKNFREDCETLGVTNINSAKAISELWTSWGI